MRANSRGPKAIGMGAALALLASCSSSHQTKGDAGTSDGGGDAGSAPSWKGDPPATEGVARVLLVSIDGFHASDLERQLSEKPNSILARLAAVGTRYPKAMAPFPSDSFPSVLAWATGGNPRTTGVFYDLSYDRTLSPPSSDCSKRGTAVDFSDAVDLDSSTSTGGGGLNMALLPRDPSRNCAVVMPHDYLRVNTIFEVVRAAGKRTAWSDKHLSYEIMNGPSGAGVDDLYDPEVAAFADGATYDKLKVTALIKEIGGMDHAGGTATVPALFGMNFQAVSMAQKAAGYADASGTPSATLALAIASVDQGVGQLVEALNVAGLWSTTLFIVAASHGQSPIDPALVTRYPTSLIPSIANEVQAGIVAAATQDSVALLWLTDSSQASAVAQHLTDKKDTAGIDHVVSGADLVSMYGDPATDARVPDVMVIAKVGSIYTDSHKKVAEHGGFSDDDRNVALLVVGRSMGGGATVSSAIETRQLAPTILTALGLQPDALGALSVEPALVLPGLTLGP